MERDQPRGRIPTLNGFDRIIKNKMAQDDEFLKEMDKEEESSEVQKGIALLMQYIQQLDKRYSKEIEEIKKNQEEILKLLKK